MRIGILIKEFNQLRDFELRIIAEIQKSDSLELALLIQDARDIKSTKNKFLRLLKSGNVLGNTLFKFQVGIEKKFFKPKSTSNRSEILASLTAIPTLKLSPKRKGFLDVFSEEDTEKVKAYNLDILLRHGFSIIRGGILNAAQYGIWSFHHGDNAINRGGPPAFWEIVLKEPIIGVTLQQLTPELDGGLVIDKGFYKKHWSVFKSNQNIIDQSVTLLFKNIRKLEQHTLSVTKSPAYYNPLYKTPTFWVMTSYMLSFYKMVLKRIAQKVGATFFGIKYECWTLFIGKGNFLNATLHKLKPVKVPKDEFWADPFLIEVNNEDYVFFENCSYKSNHGKISCGKIVDNQLTNIVDVFDLDHHLSYPFIFKEDGEIYMIPETLQDKKVSIYKCTEFPGKWELYSSAFHDESIVDTTYYKDDDGKRWLFLNKGYGRDHCSELYIYQIDSLKLDNIKAHQQNPVIIDARIARSAGPIYKNGNQLIRPSQNNSNGIYGYGLNINEIKTLNLEEYHEEHLMTVEPNFKKGLRAMHHLHQGTNKFVIDAAYKSQ